jgi:predicted PurR-regulated permease PerM
MLQGILFTVVAIALYFLCDSIVKYMEKRRGEAMKYRQFVFFGLLLSSSLLSFYIARAILGE